MENEIKYNTTIGWTNADESKEKQSIAVPFADMPKNAQEKIIAYGCQRVFNDAVGGKGKFESFKAKQTHVDGMIAKFLKGDIGRAAGAPAISTLQGEIYKLARVELKKAYAKAGKDMKVFTGHSKVEQHAILDKVVTQLPELEKAAQSIIDARKTVSVDIDISAL